jgi:hypothetical protein
MHIYKIIPDRAARDEALKRRNDALREAPGIDRRLRDRRLSPRSQRATRSLPSSRRLDGLAEASGPIPAGSSRSGRSERRRSQVLPRPFRRQTVALLPIAAMTGQFRLAWRPLSAREFCLRARVAVPLYGDMRRGVLDVPPRVGRERQGGSPDVLLEALQPGGAGDRDDPRLARQQPGERDCARVAAFRSPISSRRRTMGRLALRASGVNRGNALRLSSLPKVVVSSILPARKPLCSERRTDGLARDSLREVGSAARDIVEEARFSVRSVCEEHRTLSAGGPVLPRPAPAYAIEPRTTS